MKWFFVFLPSVFGLALVNFPGEAALNPQETRAQETITTISDQILDNLKRHSQGSVNQEQILTLFRTLLRENFDLAAISTFTLGRYARTLSTANKRKYTSLLLEFVVQTYSAQFIHYAVERFEVLKTRSDSRGRYIFVETRILLTGDTPPLDVTWRLRERGEKMLIVDLEIAGVSMVRTQQTEFMSFIRQNKGRVESLIEALEKRVTRVD